jgi:hypothetical protein
MAHAQLKISSCTESVLLGEDKGVKNKNKRNPLYSKHNRTYGSRRKHAYLALTTSYTHARTHTLREHTLGSLFKSEFDFKYSV